MIIDKLALMLRRVGARCYTWSLHGQPQPRPGPLTELSRIEEERDGLVLQLHPGKRPGA